MNVLDWNEYSIRTYRAGDEGDLILLFNRAYDHFVGFVPRTLEYWRWCILSRPNLGEDGIVVAVNASDEAVGYAVAERSGSILELCYDSNCEGKAIVSKLLCWCMDYEKTQGASSVSLNAPIQDNITRQICKELGFNEEPFAALFLRVLDLPHLLRAIMSETEKRLGKTYNEAVLISLRKFPRWCPTEVAIVVRNGKLEVSTENITQPTIQIDADISTISSCIFSSSRSLYRAILKKQLKIRPLRKVFKAVKVLSLFQLKNPFWYVPKADFG